MSLSPMLRRLPAAMKYPAWVCCSWLNRFMIARPRMLTSSRASACQAGVAEVEPSTRARTTT